jgi:Uma2 family endonuclease
MVRRIEDEIEYYYDSHPTEEDLMEETSFHRALVNYLVQVLTWLFQGQPCAIHANLNMYQTTNPLEYPLAPDIAVFKGEAYQWIRSWKIGSTGPAPQVVFEIASEETWAKDLNEKPARYAQMGVLEYFAYDPNEPPLRRSNGRRLFGWRLDAQGSVMVPMTPGTGGELWSKQLESWLVPDGVYLRLYDRNGQMRLTPDEARAKQAEIERRRAEIERRQAEIERRRAEAEARRAEAEARQAEIERKRADEEKRRADEAARQAEMLRGKLRALGIDPDQMV